MTKNYRIEKADNSYKIWLGQKLRNICSKLIKHMAPKIPGYSA